MQYIYELVSIDNPRMLHTASARCHIDRAPCSGRSFFDRSHLGVHLELEVRQWGISTQKLFNTSLNKQPGLHIYLCGKTHWGKFTGAAGALESAK